MKRLLINGNGKITIIALLCALIIVARMIWPHLLFDSSDIWLLAIAALLIFIPELKLLFPYVKRVKLGAAEVELKEEVKELGKEVEKAQASFTPSTEHGMSLLVAPSPDLDEILTTVRDSPKAALLLLSAKIDTQIGKRFQESRLVKEHRSEFPTFYLEALVKAGYYQPILLKSYMDFKSLRNKIAHNYLFEVDNNTVLSMISLGTVILSILSIEIKPQQGKKEERP
jgi:hypothetical protein